MVYSKLPPDCLNFFEAKIIIGNEKEEHSFSTFILGPGTSKEEAIQNGTYLALTDAQVKRFCGATVENRKLFDYKVEITPDLDFITKFNSNIVQGSYKCISSDIRDICHHEELSDLEKALDRTSTFGKDVSKVLGIGQN